jgi:hypothetical protein
MTNLTREQLLAFNPNIVRNFKCHVQFGNPETNPCWPWIGRTNGSGHNAYGRFGVHVGNDKWENQYAHRISCTLQNGEIPSGYDVCHRCYNPSCVNPSHLEIGTRGYNLTDSRLFRTITRGIPHGAVGIPIEHARLWNGWELPDWENEAETRVTETERLIQYIREHPEIFLELSGSSLKLP